AYLGKEVEAIGDKVVLGDSGGTRFGVSLPQGVAAAVVTIKAENGNPVRVLQAQPRPGEQSLVWDGLGINGARLPAGNYTVEVSAVDPGGRPLQASTRVVGTVTGVESRYGSIVLTVGDREVALEDVHAVRIPEAG
ncbi:MAG: flagellar hook assembly protein FlgD, partial [Geminicoccaceae bacterium]